MHPDYHICGIVRAGSCLGVIGAGPAVAVDRSAAAGGCAAGGSYSDGSDHEQAFTATEANGRRHRRSRYLAAVPRVVTRGTR